MSQRKNSLFILFPLKIYRGNWARDVPVLAYSGYKTLEKPDINMKL